jgi:hypothetical protein
VTAKTDTNLQSVKRNMHSSYVQTSTCFNQSDTRNKTGSKICSCKFCCLSYETASDGYLIGLFVYEEYVLYLTDCKLVFIMISGTQWERIALIQPLTLRKSTYCHVGPVVELRSLIDMRHTVAGHVQVWTDTSNRR